VPANDRPALLCASIHSGAPQYWARSTTMGCVEVIRVATAALASDGSSIAMLRVIRDRPGTVTCRVTGAPPAG
jgi:hypothetical protein